MKILRNHSCLKSSIAINWNNNLIFLFILRFLELMIISFFLISF